MLNLFPHLNSSQGKLKNRRFTPMEADPFRKEITWTHFET
jgi:hypothetical protein